MMLLVILVFVGLYLGPPFLLFRAAVRTDKMGLKVIASVLGLTLLLLPIWDIPITSYRFNKLCEEQGGIFVYQRVGLGEEFYLEPGEITEKRIERPDGGRTLRKMEATGKELIVEKLAAHYEISNENNYDATAWPGTVKFTTTVSDADTTLGRAVLYVGGSGWFLRKFNLGSRLPGRKCPEYDWETDRPSMRERLLYKIFYRS